MSGIYLCPSFPPETEINYFISVRWIAGRGEHSLAPSSVRRASEFILGGECTHQRLYPPPWGEARLYRFTNDCDKDDVLWKCLSFFGEHYGFNAHRAGNNVLFGDGHVAPFRKFDPAYMTYDPQQPGIDWDALAKPQPTQEGLNSSTRGSAIRSPPRSGNDRAGPG